MYACMYECTCIYSRDIEHSSFQLCAISFHLGRTPESGQYKALMLHDDTYYAVDGGASVQKTSMFLYLWLPLVNERPSPKLLARVT